MNTLVQYVSDNLIAIKKFFKNIYQCIESTHLSIKGQQSKNESSALKNIFESYGLLDLGDILAEIRPTLDQRIDGLSLVQNIARSIKKFAHPLNENKKCLILIR